MIIEDETFVIIVDSAMLLCYTIRGEWTPSYAEVSLWIAQHGPCCSLTSHHLSSHSCTTFGWHRGCHRKIAPQANPARFLRWYSQQKEYTVTFWRAIGNLCGGLLVYVLVGMLTYFTGPRGAEGVVSFFVALVFTIYLFTRRPRSA